MNSGTIYFNPQPLTEPEKPSAQFHVDFRLVKEVSDFDYPQAKVAWEALIEAGIEPGDLIINGLSQGHGYEIEKFSTQTNFRSKMENLLAESQTTDQNLISYSYGKTNKLLTSNKQDATMLHNPTALEKIEEKNTIEIKAVIKQELIKISS